MKVVGDVPEVGAYARPLALVEGLSQVAAAFLADSLCGGPFLHSSATTLRGEPASSRPGSAPVPHRSRPRCTPETGMPRPWSGCWARTPSPGASEAEVVPRRTGQDRAAAIGTDQSPPGPPVVGRHRFVVATDLKNQTSAIRE